MKYILTNEELPLVDWLVVVNCSVDVELAEVLELVGSAVVTLVVVSWVVVVVGLVVVVAVVVCICVEDTAQV